MLEFRSYSILPSFVVVFKQGGLCYYVYLPLTTPTLEALTMLWHLLLISCVTYVYSTFRVRRFCFYCDRYTSRGTTKTFACVHRSKKTAGDDDEIDNDNNHDDDPDNRSHPRSVMSSLLHLIMLMMMMMMTATATPVDTGTNSPTIYVHLQSPPPVLILMRSVSFDFVSIVTGTPDANCSWYYFLC